MYNITVIPGDGIGPEVTEATLKVLEASGVSCHWQTAEMGHGAWERHGNPVPPETVAAMRKSDASLKGPCITARGAPYRSANVTCRLELDLFACARPCKAYPGVRTPFPGTDLVLIRGNTEDKVGGGQFPAGSPQAQAIIEAVRNAASKTIPADAALSLSTCTEVGTTRLARFAFDYARRNGRHKVTVGVKAGGANHMEVLFWQVCQQVGKEYPDIEFEYEATDVLCLQLVRRPQHFDVLLAGSFGGVLSGLCAGLVGGLGVAAGGNFGDGVAVFEAAHGSAPNYTGQNKVNPMALILSGALMLRHLGEGGAADRVEAAVAAQVAEGKCLTYDVAPTPEAIHGTREVADELARRVRGFKNKTEKS
jgi:isocitrate dehydrogenase (NAD+)